MRGHDFGPEIATDAGDGAEEHEESGDHEEHVSGGEELRVAAVAEDDSSGDADRDEGESASESEMSEGDAVDESE